MSDTRRDWAREILENLIRFLSIMFRIFRFSFSWKVKRIFFKDKILKRISVIKSAPRPLRKREEKKENQMFARSCLKQRHEISTRIVCWGSGCGTLLVAFPPALLATLRDCCARWLVVYMQNNFLFFLLAPNSRIWDFSAWNFTAIFAAISGRRVKEFAKVGGKIGKFSGFCNEQFDIFMWAQSNTPNQRKNWCEGKNLFFSSVSESAKLF